MQMEYMIAILKITVINPQSVAAKVRAEKHKKKEKIPVKGPESIIEVKDDETR